MTPETNLKIMKNVQYRYSARCISVISGDTIDALIDLGFGTWVKRRVRLHDIIAPAMNSRDPNSRRRAKIAQMRLKDLIYNDTFIIDSIQLGKYSSTAVIYCQGHNINQQMIDEGHAVKRDAQT